MEAMSFDQLRAATGALGSLRAMNVMSALAQDKSFVEHFYLSGYEGLCVQMGHEELTRSIISTAVPMEGELLVVGGDELCGLWRRVCASLRIRVSAIDVERGDVVVATETLLKVNQRITHILCSTQLDAEVVRRLTELAHRNGRSVIVDSTSDSMDMGDIEKSGVDFAISAGEGDRPVSVIVARRSRLVMTEGNARRREHDIYMAWQASLEGRTSRIRPMA